MALRNAVMAALLDGEASGYDLAKGFGAGLANFWTATPQQLYRELERMEADGLIQARLVRQERRPNKRLFALTDAGRQALYEFTAAAPRPTAIRDELTVKVHALDSGDGQSVRASIVERKLAAEVKLARYARLRARLLDGRSEDDYVAHAERVGPYLSLLRGVAFEEENIRWAEQALRILEKRSAVAR
jgi:DNA-binding PadR family transcriptional regulator